MPYYQDQNAGLHFLSVDDIANGGLSLLPKECTEISEEQAEAMLVPTAEQLLVASAQSALTAGLSIKSGLSPELDGTYACDRLSHMDIIALETGLNAGKGFPGGAPTFNYPSVDGVMRVFSAANFLNFAAEIRDYVYALNSVIAGASSTLPASIATID